MCLYPVYGINPKYKPNKKNGGRPPKCTDQRLLYVPFKCGKCIECRKQKQREWRVRLSEELRENFGYFVTTTFSDDGVKYLESKTGMKWESNVNEIMTYAVRLFLERVRAATGKSMRHWFITELGEDKARGHLHGIIFGQTSAALLKKHWTFGGVYIGTYTNEKSVNYMTKYMLKVDLKHKDYTGIVLASKGIGNGYLKRNAGKWQKENHKRICVPTYTFRNGTKMAMPKYYRDKLFTEEERQVMWLNNLERGYEYIGGERVDANDQNSIENLRQFYRERGKTIFFDDPIAWDLQKERRKAERQRRAVRIRQRVSKFKELVGNDAKRWAKQDKELYKKMIQTWRRNESKLKEINQIE